MAVRLIGRVIVNAAIENLRDGATFHTTFHQFLCNESGTGTAEVIIDGFTACGTVGSADDLNFQAIPATVTDNPYFFVTRASSSRLINWDLSVS